MTAAERPSSSAVLRLLNLAAGLRAPAGERGRLTTLIYHRVLPEPDPMQPRVVDARAFDWHMQLVSEHFNVLTLAEAVQHLASRSLPERALCVTFDDGYADNAEVALPLLVRHGVPATFFVATAYLDGGMMFNDRVIEGVRRVRDDRLDLRDLGLGIFDVTTLDARRRAVDELIRILKSRGPGERCDLAGDLWNRLGAEECQPMMTSAQVRALIEGGMDVGGHTHTHPILAQIDDSAARDEIAAGRERLQEITGREVRLFAYPNGRPGQDYRPHHVEMVRDAGFDAAVSTRWGTADSGTDRFELPRFLPWDRSAWRFLARLIRNYGTYGTAYNADWQCE